MLLTPTLALIAIVFNFCALLHVSNNRNSPSTSRWHTLDRAIYALEETTTAAYESYLDIIAPPPRTSSPVYSPTLHHAEWVYRSSAVRILDLVDGSGKAQTVSDFAFPPTGLPSSPSSPTKPTNNLVPTAPLPNLTSSIYPATRSTLSVIASPVAWFLGLTGFISCLVYMSKLTWLKNHRPRQFVYVPRPTLTCDVDCQIPVEDFHSIFTATSIPSYPGSEVDFSEFRSRGSSGRPQGSRVDFSTASRTFPVVVTNSGGQTLFNAEIKLSSNHVVTESSATASTVSFSIDVIASLDAPTVSEWYMPAKEDSYAPAKAEDFIFLLLVRGLSDRSPLTSGPQDLDCIFESKEGTLFADHNPQSGAHTLVSDLEVEDTGTRDIVPLGSPACPINIPIHHRGFSSFETALINSGTKARRENAHRENCSHRRKGRTSIRPRDVRFAWLKDIYTCGDDHMDGCLCEETLAEDALSEPQYPPRHVMSEQSANSEDGDAEMGSTGEITGETYLTNDTCSPPSPVVPAQVDSLLDALEPILAGCASTPSPEEATSVHPPFTPLQYRSSSVRAYERSVTPEHDDWVGESTGSLTPSALDRF